MKKVLFLHGWTNKRPVGHWMRLTAKAAREHGHQVWYPQFPSPDTPKPHEWQDLLRQESDMMDEIESGEKIAIAHSLGTINWIYGALTDLYQKPFDRVLLVALPDPQMTSQAEGISGEPLNLENPLLPSACDKWAREITVMASDNDRWQPRGPEVLAKAIGKQSLIVPNAGHFSLDDGWGRFIGLERWIDSANPQDLMQR